MKTNKLFHIFIIFLVLLQSLVYPWISILPAPPGVQAAESPPEEATLAASTPAPSPLEPNSLDQILNQILSTSTQSAQTPRPEAIPEATISALPEAIPETPTSTPSATLEPQSSPSTLPLDLPSSNSSHTDVISSTPSPAPTNTPSPIQKTATSLTANTSQLAPLLDPFDINLSYPFVGTYPISYSFGEHSHNDYISGMQSLFGVNAHDGIDFAMPVGTPILATADGNIISSGTGLYGTTIQIEHTWGISYYGHLSDLAIGEGESVTAGQIIGYSGMSGITTGPHLHFGIRPLSPNLLNGYHGLIDPYPYFGSTKYSHVLGVKNGKSIRFNPRIRQIKNKFTFPKKSLKNDESLIQLDFAKAESKDLSIILRNPKGVETNLTHVVENLNGPLGGVLTLDLNESLDLVPGRYELTITDADGNYDTQDFTWGVLAINTNKTIYLPASAVDFSMAVLDNQGDMVCDASINLEITSPTGVVTKLSSQSGEVTVNLVTCLSKNYTLTPDYQTSFVPNEIGDYLVKMSATTADGTRSIDSNFRVQNSVPFDVERVTITRIYPRLDYPVILRVHAFEDYIGTVEDVIPTNFELIKPSGDTNPEYTLTQRGDNQVLTWNVVWQKGHDYVLTYQFNPPDKSPDFYTLGPLKIGNRFSEIKKWQLAIDVTTTIILNNTHTILTSGTTWTVPADWTDGNNTIEVIGGGGAGRTDTTGIAGVGGGGGGAYAKSVNIALTPGASVTYQIGGGGIPTSVNGTDTFFNRTSGSAGTCADTTSACAKGGTGATSATGAAGGLASSSFATGTGNVKNNGGTGGTGNTTADSGGGGGGAGGPNGAGGTGGAGDTDNSTDGVGGGGGGNGGGAAGGSGITSDTVGANGGNGNGGTGGGTGGTAADGANGTANTGGGGGGGSDNMDGGHGANGSDLVAGVAVGSGGGGGGTGDTATTTGMGGNGGLYGGGGGGGRYGGFGAPGVIIITYNGNTPTKNTWVVPVDWNSSDNTVTVIGGGGAGVSSAQGTGAGGGGGGGYSKSTNLSLTLGASVDYQVGEGGRKVNRGAGAGTAGTATFFNRTAGSAGTCSDTVSVCANPGAAGSGTTGGAGGSTTGADGTTLFAGGAGGAGNSTGDTSGGGGGAGGTAVGQVGGAGPATTPSAGGGGGGGAGGTSSSVGQVGQAATGGTGGNGPAGTGSGTAGNAGHGGAGTAATGGGGGGGDDVFGGGVGGSGSSTTYGGGGGGGAGDNNTAATSQAYGGFGGLHGGGGGGGLTNGFGAEGIIIITYTPAEITISGTANGNDGATVKWAKNGTVQAGTATITASAWTITGITPPPSAGDIITVWVDGVTDANESTAVTKWNSGNISGMVLNTNVLTVGSNQDQSLSITNLNSYDCSEDEDIMHQAASSHLKVEGDACAGSTTNIYTSEKISTLSGDTLALGTSETLTTYDLENAGTITVTGNGTFNVAHDWANTGTFTSGTSTTNLTGGDSTTQTISGNTSFYNLAATTTSNSAGRTIRYTAGTTTTVTGTWTATGTSTKILTLESSTTSPWIINPSAVSLNYLSVSYSSNHGIDFCATNTTDAGNNARWSTTCEPSAQSFQRKTFYDDQNSRYWRFSTDGTDIDAEYSSDGTSWNASTTLAYNTNDFSVEYKSISGTEYAVLAVASSNDIIVRRGTLGTSSVTWDGTASVALNGTSATDSYSYPTISLNSSNGIWVGARYYDGTNYSYRTNTTSYNAEAITHEETETGSADEPATSVTTDANLTAATNHLYLASVGMKLNLSVTSVTGLGLTWTLIDAQCSGRGQSRTEIWYAQGTPSGDGAVTANISAGVQDSVIAVSRYSGVSTTDALGTLVSSNSNGVNGGCTGGTDASFYSASLTTTRENSMIYGAASLRQESHNPGTGYTERADRNSTNVSTGSRAGITVQEQIMSSVGSYAVNGATTSLDITDYSVVATEILPIVTGTTLDQSVGSWTWGTSPNQLSSSTAGNTLYGVLAPLATDNMYVTLKSGGNIIGCTWVATEGVWKNSADSSCESSSGGSWYSTSWNYRVKVTIDANRVDADLTDYPVYVNLNNLPSSFHTNVNQTDARDIRVTKADGTTELPREVVYYTSASDTGELHVKYTGTLSGTNNTDIYIYYGNAGASDYSSTDTYGRNNVWTGYHSVWHLQEASGVGAYLIDSTGNTHDATPTNTTSAAGKFGNARSFDGNGDFLTVTAPTLPTGDFTYESWGYRTSLATDNVIFMSSEGTGTNELLLEAMSSTNANPNSLRYTADGSSTYSTTDLTSGAWQAMSMTRSTATITGYINGAADAATGSDGTALSFSTCDLYIGKDVNGGCDTAGPDWYDGLLDELRISSTARSSTWMSTNYKNHNSPDTFFGNFGTQEQSPYVSDAIDTTPTLTSDNLSLLSDGTNLHLAYVDDETTDQISYRKYSSGSWSASTLVADAASNDDTYPTISLDTTNGDLYVLWIDGATSDVIYSSCDTTTNCDTAGEWAPEINHDSTGVNTQITSNVSAAGKIFFLYSDGVSIVWDEISIGSSNTAPNSPTSLVQKTTGDVTLATGDWLSATSVKFSATATDTDNPDTLYLCVEKDLLGVSFSNTEDSCGSGVAYSGSGVTVTHTISSQTDASEYHWQARVKDTAGTYSAWVSYDVNAESARDYGLDTTAPTGGTVYDGTSAGVDSTFSDSSLSSLSANWASVVSDVSGLSKYEYSIGTSAGGTDIKNWTDNTTSTSVTTTGLTLQSSTLYYFNVRTTDGADNVSTPISSNGQLVSPSISFSVSPNPLTFANINSANSYSDTKTTTLTTSTNAYNGYVIRAFVSDYLRSSDSISTIPDFTAGTYASPATWAGSETGLGYTSSDTTIGGSDKFGSGTLYAPFSHSGPGDIVADHTSNVSGTPISNETFTLTYKIKTPATQVAKRYSNTVILTATAQY